MPAIGHYDPDYNPFDHPQKRQPWQSPKSDLAKEAFSAIGKKYFNGTSKQQSWEYQEWRAIEDKALGYSEDSYLFRKWVEDCIEYARKENRMNLYSFSFKRLLYTINKTENRMKWIQDHYQELMDERAKSVPMEFKSNKKWIGEK